MEKQFYTAQEANSILALMQAITEMVEEGHEIISGHLFASLLGKISLDNYQYTLSVLEDTNKIKIEHHVIKRP